MKESMRQAFKTVLILFIPLFCSPLKSQTNLNMTLQDSMRYNAGVNDVCGWFDSLGREYALVGLSTGVSIVNIDSTPIKEVVHVPGVNNLWRDINTYGHYAYVVTEARAGLTIIDLQYLPDSVKTYVWKDTLPTLSGGRPFEKAHTIWIDEYGIGYLNGSNLNDGGVVMVDLTTNPTDPIFLGYAPNIYSHDSYARDSILYSAEIYQGTVSLYDIHDPQDVKLIGRVTTPTEFTHNAWLSDDSRYMFTTDERPNSYVASYDIQDPANIKELDRFRQAATDGSGNIPHNVYVWNDWLVVAYYTSGTLIVDAARPDNLIEVGSFDSFLGPDGNYNGVWGSFPFLPSGKIISSDRQSGLFVFIPNYVRAAYLEGTVLDSITHLPIQNASVVIESSEIILPQSTAINGQFKTGKAIPGTFNVTVTKAGYFPKTIQLTFVNGELLTPVIELNPLPTYVFSGKVVDVNGNEVPGAQVVLSGPEGVYEAVTDAAGEFLLPAVFGGQYDVQAGIWGQTFESDMLVESSQNILLQLVPGYYDDFDLDLGWTVSGDATLGEWERGIPTLQYLFDNWVCGSATDSPYDQGDFTASTGISNTNNVVDDEVEGTTVLISPPMDLDSIFTAHISFDYWLCELPPNQYVGLTVWLTNGEDTVLITELTNDTIAGSWQSYFTEVHIIGWTGPKDNFQILFIASDTTTGQNNYFIKAHIDHFSLVDATLSTKDENSNSGKFLLYPNPVEGEKIYLRSEDELKGSLLNFTICDTQGRVVSTRQLSLSEVASGFTHQLENGMYFVQWKSDEGESGVGKILVMKK